MSGCLSAPKRALNLCLLLTYALPYALSGSKRAGISGCFVSRSGM